MTLRFEYKPPRGRIVFAPGASRDLGAAVSDLGGKRALILSTPQQEGEARALAASIGDLAAGVFAGATMHTPVEVTEAAIASASAVGADCLVSMGGGSTTGLGKAIAYRTGLPQIAIPTTYAGSEVTDILGQTSGGQKTTLRDAKVVPEIVLYDPELTVGLPVAMSVNSGLNAMAHAAEALYAPDRNPITTLMAVEGLRALRDSLARIVTAPRDLEARSTALYGAWLCGTVLGSVAMSLHHKLCHTLGGAFDLPHAETHAILLPHTIGFNAVAIPDLLRPIRDLFGTSPGQALYDYAGAVGAPRALRDFGLTSADLDRATALATANPYANPREVEPTGVRALLQAAWAGDRPPQ